MTMMEAALLAPDCDDSWWQAVERRDARANGDFVFAVRTTGIYCRPSCPARRPRREHVRFFAGPAAAERAGFRACLRCHPDRDDAAEAAAIAAACRLIASAESPPSRDALAAAAGLEAGAFARMFRRLTGTSPRAYAQAVRAGRLRTTLAGEGRVLDAALDAGYPGVSRFYASAPEVIGMAPARYRTGGAGETIRFAIGATSLGPLLVAATARGLVAIEFGDSEAGLAGLLRARFAAATLIGDDPAFAATIGAVIAAIEEPRAAHDLPLDIRGTAFQQRVWAALRAIPPGQAMSYGALAAAIDAPKAVRAVAGACAANRLAVAIPCHRIVGRDGALTGYRWGTERKRALLDREADG